MRTFYVVVDTNDADYVGKLVHVSDEKVEKWMPLIEKIKNCDSDTQKRLLAYFQMISEQKES